MPAPLTLMAVHAHPDDESIGTGGILAKYADDGIQTILVTCTGGEVGEIAHESLATADNLAEVRERELRSACDILGVAHLELLGYRDSGMVGTPANEDPRCFLQADLTEATGRLVALIRRHRPQVLVTYDENGFYGHPDHINANRITVRAFGSAGDPARYSEQELRPWQPSKLYYTAIPRSRLGAFMDRLAAAGLESPIAARDEDPPFGTPDELVTSFVDVQKQVTRKRKAMFAHATQMGPNAFFTKLPAELFDEIFSHESFQLVESSVPTTRPESDLFAGLR